MAEVNEPNITDEKSLKVSAEERERERRSEKK